MAGIRGDGSAGVDSPAMWTEAGVTCRSHDGRCA